MNQKSKVLVKERGERNSFLKNWFRQCAFLTFLLCPLPLGC